MMARGSEEGSNAASKMLPWAARKTGELPANVFRYVLDESWLHQLMLLLLTVTVFMLEVAPLELQRRAVNDLVKHRDYRLVISLCAIYAGVVLVQGANKLALNVYRGWVGERAKRDLRRRIEGVIELSPTVSPAAEAQVKFRLLANAVNQLARGNPPGARSSFAQSPVPSALAEQDPTGHGCKVMRARLN